ncbi:hypothetical protein N7492_010352 [Penicillium capsulatum]|uniref:Uncharacterized protein n=1 Tax=Penicillium capsulatum TaxID=69766 RepID=A0A9W9HM99_9EURO|nr:hypothetical protein N7492_010352 [Penicillium capsulatum]KAJ6112857.1 hypothetical protein N7512_008181 [Penicillium capsulatum]
MRANQIRDAKYPRRAISTSSDIEQSVSGCTRSGQLQGHTINEHRTTQAFAMYAVQCGNSLKQRGLTAACIAAVYTLGFGSSLFSRHTEGKQLWIFPTIRIPPHGDLASLLEAPAGRGMTRDPGPVDPTGSDATCTRDEG